jgi:hypothetical protein
MKKFVIIQLLSMLLFSACAGLGKQTPTAKPFEISTLEVKMEEGFRLEIGEKAVIPEHDLSIQFIEITNDNRCPTSVDCIVAGWASASILWQWGDASKMIELHVGGTNEDQPSEIAMGDYLLKLVNVTPYPQEPTPISAELYAVEMMVTLAE